MLRGSPQFTNAESAVKVDLKHENTAENGFVMASQFQPIESVKLDSTALLRIVKHARDFAPNRVNGDLLGTQLGSTVEVTSVLPTVSTGSLLSGLTDAERDKKEEEDKKDRANALRLMRESGFGGLVVGTYNAASQSSFFSAHNVKTLQAQVTAGYPCLLLVYDPVRSQLGKLYLRAFTLSPPFVPTREQRSDSERIGSPLREVPISMSASVLSKSLLYQHVAPKCRGAKNVVVEQGSLERYNERLLQAEIEAMEKIRSDLYQLSNANEKGSLKMETRILCLQLREQATHVAAVAQGSSLNLNFASLSTQ